MTQRLQKKIIVFAFALCLIATGINLYPDDMCTVLASEMNTEPTEESMAEQAGEAESMAEQTGETESGDNGKSDIDARETEEQEVGPERTEYIKDGEGSQSGNTVSGNNIGVPVDKAEELIRKPKILLKSCNLSGAELGAGSQNWLEAVFKNSSESETIYNLKVTVGTGSSSMQVIPNSFYFSMVEPGKDIRLEGELKADVNAESSTFPLYFEFEYEDEKGNVINGKESISVTVTGQPAVHQPILLVESCNLSEKDLGEDIQEQMIVAFKNHSDSQAIYNLKVMASAGSSMQLVPGSFYFSKVGPGEVISIEGSLKVAAKAESGVVPLTFDFQYEDWEGVAATGQETVYLTVVHPIRMELDVAHIPSFVYASETQELSVRALNLSRTGVYNVRISLSGTGLFPKEDVFIGNMDAGTEGSGTMHIYVGTRTMTEIGTDAGNSDEEKYGEINGTITLRYEDAKGESYEITQDFQTEIKKAQILSLEVNEKVETNSWQISVFVIIIIGLAILAISLWFRLRKKNVLLEEARKIQDES